MKQQRSRTEPPDHRGTVLNLSRWCSAPAPSDPGYWGETCMQPDPSPVNEQRCARVSCRELLRTHRSTGAIGPFVTSTAGTGPFRSSHPARAVLRRRCVLPQNSTTFVHQRYIALLRYGRAGQHCHLLHSKRFVRQWDHLQALAWECRLFPAISLSLSLSSLSRVRCCACLQGQGRCQAEDSELTATNSLDREKAAPDTTLYRAGCSLRHQAKTGHEKGMGSR